MLTYCFRCAFFGRVLAAAFCAALFSFVFVSDVVWGAPFIVNEWNAVKSSKQLDDGDTFFGTIDGNGGNWIELLVIEDHLDVRGWKLAWTEDEDEDGTPAGNSAGEIILAHTRNRVDGLRSVLMRDSKRAVPRFLALWMNSKNARYKGSFS